jgi:hypothetical protein
MWAYQGLSLPSGRVAVARQPIRQSSPISRLLVFSDRPVAAPALVLRRLAREAGAELVTHCGPGGLCHWATLPVWNGVGQQDAAFFLAPPPTPPEEQLLKMLSERVRVMWITHTPSPEAPSQVPESMAEIAAWAARLLRVITI